MQRNLYILKVNYIQMKKFKFNILPIQYIMIQYILNIYKKKKEIVKLKR